MVCGVAESSENVPLSKKAQGRTHHMTSNAPGGIPRSAAAWGRSQFCLLSGAACPKNNCAKNRCNIVGSLTTRAKMDSKAVEDKEHIHYIYIHVYVCMYTYA